jgi:hypothetical protein
MSSSCEDLKSPATPSPSTTAAPVIVYADIPNHVGFWGFRGFDKYVFPRQLLDSPVHITVHIP